MFYEEPNFPEGSYARGAPSTFGELWDAAVEKGRRVDNVNARWRAMSDAYDARIAAVKEATGVDLENPYRSARGSTAREFGLEDESDPFAAFDEQLRVLAGRHPDKAAAIGADRPVLEDALQSARDADQQMADRMSRAAPGMGKWLAALGGGVRAAFEDPVNLATMALGPLGRAGPGWRGALWMAARNGAANMAVETAFQPVIQDWRRRAGLEYGVSDAAMSVAAAGVLGFGLDAGVRGVYRGVQRARGRTAVLDADGLVSGYRAAGDDPAAALEAAARGLPDGHPVRRAADGDAAALEEVARSVAGDDPLVRGAMLARDIDDGVTHQLPGFDDGDNFQRLTQALRHLDDANEPPPIDGVALPRVADDPLDPAAAAARMEIESGRVTGAMEMAALVRQHPALAATVMPGGGETWRQARALARLSDEAWADVSQGGAPAHLALLVADLVPDAGDHARVLRTLVDGRPESAAEARGIIGDLRDEARHADAVRTPLRGFGIDDPAGSEAAAHVATLERELAGEIEAARKADLATGQIPDNVLALRADLDDAARVDELRQIIEACRG